MEAGVPHAVGLKFASHSGNNLASPMYCKTMKHTAVCATSGLQYFNSGHLNKSSLRLVSHGTTSSIRSDVRCRASNAVAGSSYLLDACTISEKAAGLSSSVAQQKLGVLLLNLGGPETLEDVEPFLFNLFSDPDIIRLPRPFGFLQRPLAKLISTFRAPKSREGYASIGGGSPLRRITDEQVHWVCYGVEFGCNFKLRSENELYR